MYKHVVFFKDKDTVAYSAAHPAAFFSPRALQRKQEQRIKMDVTDLPVNSVYLEPLRKDSAFMLRGTSRWFNCAIVFSSQKNAGERLGQLPGVERVIDVGYSSVKKAGTSSVSLDEMVSSLEQKFSLRSRKRNDSSASVYGAGFKQAQMIGVPELHSAGLNGAGTRVAVIDAGFSKANTHKVFLNTLKNVVATYDFVDLEPDVFNDDDHGTAVWSCIGASDSFNFIGTAPAAEYVLLRSEDASSEFPVEEFYWLLAAEFADSMGADIISTSLGYNEFSEHKYNYVHKQLNGETAWISKAASMASQKGMLVICSAGNEGDGDWKQITFPADAAEVITVGAVDKNGRYARFSSLGPTADKRIKPNLVAMGEGTSIASDLGNVYSGNGTSYSCPVLAGGIACLWPELKRYDFAAIRHLLELSTSGFDDPDKYFGYGVPDLVLARKLAATYTEDTLLDVRQADDGSFYATLFFTQKQKLRVTMKDSTGKVIGNQQVQVKQAGNTRIKTAKQKKALPGSYTLFIDARERSFAYVLEVK